MMTQTCYSCGLRRDVELDEPGRRPACGAWNQSEGFKERLRRSFRFREARAKLSPDMLRMLSNFDEGSAYSDQVADAEKALLGLVGMGLADAHPLRLTEMGREFCCWYKETFA